MPGSEGENLTVRRFFKNLFPSDFKIDEPIEEIFLHRTAPDFSSAREVPEQEDLITLISRVMIENEQLQDVKKELKMRSASPGLMENFMRRMVTLLDGFERILNLARTHSSSRELDNWLKSVETLYYRLLHILEKYGLKSFDTVGKPVDLDYNEVVEYRPTTEHPSDTVISERQRGYLLNGKLIRDAKVVVAYNPTFGMSRQTKGVG